MEHRSKHWRPINLIHPHCLMEQGQYYFIQFCHWRLIGVLASDDWLPFYYNSIRYTFGFKPKRVSSQESIFN